MSIEKSKSLAIKNNGYFLGTIRKNGRTKYAFRCKNNHEWEWVLSKYPNKWCKVCTKNDFLNKAKNYAEDNFGFCLSSEYISAHKKLKFQCKEGHFFDKSYANLFNNKFCKKCSYGNLSVSFRKNDRIQECKEYAKSRGGWCLSEDKDYINQHSLLKWKCKHGHIWDSSYKEMVYPKYWCKSCGNRFFYRENDTRRIFEYLFDAEFPSSYPEWNKNPETNYKLQLDGFNEKLKLGFEFQGKQHYEINGFIKTKEELEYLQRKDKIKKENCKNNNVKLIIIDDIDNYSSKTHFILFIIDTIEKNNIKITKKINFDDLLKKLEESIDDRNLYDMVAKKHAELKTGEKLSCYSTMKEKMKWKCLKHNRVFNSSYEHTVKRNHWNCPDCTKKYSKQEMLQKAKGYAITRGGECLTLIYKDNRTLMQWRCLKHNKNFESSYAHTVGRNKWSCPGCINKTTKQEMLQRAKDYAITRGGECLTLIYKDNITLMRWRCIKHSRDFNASFNNMGSRNKWSCPNCMGRYSKEEMLQKAKDYAINKNGDCLSLKYENTKKLMIWKCIKHNFEFNSSYEHTVKRKHWNCKYCISEK